MPEAAEPAAPAEPIVTTQAEQTAFTIVVLGDSLTAGYGLDREDALPEQMADILEKSGKPVNMVNAGVSGDTTAGGLARYDFSVKSAKPDLLVVALGANDFLNGMSAEAAKANLGEIIGKAQSDGVQVILASVETGDVSKLDSRIEAYANIYPELAAAYDVPLFKGLLTGVRGRTDLIQLDGLHPTKAGVAIMAERMAAFVGDYVPDEAVAP